MQSEFWLDLWRRGRIGFHRDAPMAQLTRHWPTLALPAGSRVLVPLAGKSPDLLWLAERGLRVLGVELSPLAVQQFVDEHDLPAERHESAQGTRYIAGNIEIINGDIFDLDAATLAGCDAIYDRAAMVALPPDMRDRYIQEIYGRLPAHAKGLLITLDYQQSKMDGPPFSVPSSTVHNRLDNHWTVQEVDRDDMLKDEPHFREKGLDVMETAAYTLVRNA